MIVRVLFQEFSPKIDTKNHITWIYCALSECQIKNYLSWVHGLYKAIIKGRGLTTF